MDYKKVIAVDFDGTLFTDNWPYVGEPILPMINKAKKEQANGAALILWTCRDGEDLDRAVEACKEYGLIFNAVNANLPERIEQYKNDTRKIGADEYWDDRAIHPNKLIHEYWVEEL